MREVMGNASHAEEVREHLATVLAGATFASSPRLRQFLAFIVERTLEGDHDGLKEYVIATEVYGRPVTYDPQVDSTVRVEAGRLRRRLQDFYDGEGKGSRIEIQLPKGHYVPVFVSAVAQDVMSAAPEPEPVATPTGSVAWVAISIAFVVGIGLWHSAPRFQALL